MSLMETLREKFPAETPEKAAKSKSGATRVKKAEAPELPEAVAEANYLPIMLLALGGVLVAVALAGRSQPLQVMPWESQPEPEPESRGDLQASQDQRPTYGGSWWMEQPEY